ncbi:hypothetical protein SAMN05421798_1625, partial [Pseudovibrio axinellae]
AALQQHLLNLAQAEGEAVIEPNNVSDNFGWKAMAFVTDRSTSHVAQLPIEAGAKVNLITPSEMLAGLQ